MKRDTKYTLAAFIFYGQQLTSAYASQHQGLAWESPWGKLENFLVGPYPKMISLLMIIACFGILIFGGELNEFAKRTIYAAIGVAGVVGAISLLTNIFGGSGAVLGV